ncbi:hypothetical protein BOW53_16665 [Solemya pervernicosa gill symbiont]|uniref:Immunity protein 30 domain-containing protein n=1 Tax=Solemya pervernicosa gill symbiont TaxID=642797 RepID=A0A1T2KYY7_9GAMM|nr:hypothetical protein [Solemya pervernicosa gill symbiont]OOZ38055.1 hypothetical protein BOW53_16665 [Solemya pervernicosa gill symbiont]
MDEDKHAFISQELAETYLSALERSSGNCDLHEFLNWLVYKSDTSPDTALAITEQMLSMIKHREEPCHIWKSEEITNILASLLREADASDNLELIERTINVQDRLLELGTFGMDELYRLATDT